MTVTVPQADKRIISYVFLCLLIAFYLPHAAIQVGFALKPSMILLPILLLFHPKRITALVTYEKLLLLFGVTCSIAHLSSNNMPSSFRMWAGTTLFLACYFIYREYFIKFFSLKTLVWFGLGYCFYSLGTYLISFLFFDKTLPIGEYFIGVLYDRGLYRMAGPAGSPNYLSFYLFPIFFILWEFRSKAPRWAWLAPIVCVLLTFSLSSYLGLILAFILGQLIVGIKLTKKNLKTIGWLAAGACLIVISIIAIHGSSEASLEALRTRINSLNTGSGRYHMWRYVVETFYSHSLFTGIGLNNLQIATKELFRITNIHNTYLEILIEQGLIGLSMYMAFLFAFGYACYLEAKKNDGSYWPLFTLIAVSINAFFVSATITPDVLVSYLLITGTIRRKTPPIRDLSKNTPFKTT